MAAINKRKLLESAQKNLQKGALDKALKDYQELLAADPRDLNVRLKVGDLQLKRGNADDAITAYLKVADQFMRDGFDAKAVAIYKQVSKIDPKRFDIFIPLADLYQRMGLTTDAMAALQTAAESYQRDGRRREALDLLRRMASLDPTNTTSRLKVAELLFQEQLVEEAIAEFDEAAAELERQGDWEARAGVLQRLLEVSPNRIETFDALISLWLERNQATRAEPLARKLVALDLQRAESHELLANVLHARGQQEGAVEAFKAAAEVFRARGDEERARQIMQRHVPSEPFDGSAVASAGVTSPITESPFGEEGIGGERPPETDEFRFVDDGEPAPPIANADADGDTDTDVDGGDDDFELELDDAPSEPVPAPAPPPRAEAKTVVREVAPAPAPPAAAKKAAPEAPPAASDEAAEELGVADVEQLLAEAAVYLRYGKHERAIASLASALAQEPQHLGALEALGDAHLRADDAAEAIAVWSRAHGIANAANDADRASALHARIEAIDADAAAALVGSAADAASPEAESPAADSEDLDEFEIDVEDSAFDDEVVEDEMPAEEPQQEEAPADAASESFEIEIDAGAFESAADEASHESVEAAASESAVEDVPVPDSFDEVVEESADEDTTGGVSEPEPEPEQLEFAEPIPTPDTTSPEASAPPVAPAPVVAAPAAASDESGTTAQQIVEDLEEASFYFEQGLFDEAEAIYRRVVERAPRHPAALLRLGEIAVARGQDPSRAAVEDPAVEAPTAAPVETEASDAAPTIDPPDDLDLTAREFGPQREWEDENEATEDPVAAASSDAPVADANDASLDRTDPAEWTTPDASVAPVVPAPEVAVAPAPEPTPEPVAAAPPPAVETPPAPAPSAPEPPPFEMTAPQIPAEEDGAAAFDLAAELSEALRDEPAATPARSGATDEDGFAALFSEFKKGVSRTLDEGDVETHFDLGIAYREMGLLDDAIGEFRYALGSNTRRLDALHMMGLCALDIGRPADGVGHLEQALASPDVPHDREAPLRYDLGRAYEANGERDRAIDAFARVVELDAGFQDAAERLEELRNSSGSTPAPAVAEAYESFDDLIAHGDEEASDAAPVAQAESYESFEEFSGEDEDASDASEAVAVAEVAEAEPAVDTEESPVAEAEPEPEPEAAPEPEPEPAPEEPPRRRRKISFF